MRQYLGLNYLKLLLPAAVPMEIKPSCLYTVFQEIGYYDQSRSRTACDR